MRTCLPLGILLGFVGTTACGGADDDGATPPPDPLELTAVWQLSATVNSNTCGLPDGGTNTDRIILIQCGNSATVIAGPGLWGTATISGQDVNITGTEAQTDNTGCRTTHQSTGTLSGTSALLEGTLSTNITFDQVSCGPTEACTVETNLRLSSPTAYLSSCLNRDEFGDPAQSEYILPWPAGESYAISNSYCIPTGGHRQQQAYDFLIPIDDPVAAARAGVVRQVKEDSADDGQGSDHNHVMVEHADGTVGFYAHLRQEGVLVEVGDNVAAGQTIALAGHSGTDDVVHLHFGVYDDWPPVEGSDRAVNFSNMDGPLDCRGGLVNGATYTAH
jgi:murein DD-endopeptidase MepM/ murein hydrolase activator NlpD